MMFTPFTKTYEAKKADAFGAGAKAAHESNGNENASDRQQKVMQDVSEIAVQCEHKHQ